MARGCVSGMSVTSQRPWDLARESSEKTTETVVISKELDLTPRDLILKDPPEQISQDDYYCPLR